MIRFRGHHLICLHFFSGEGYDEVFVRNLKDVLQRAENEEIEVCNGADDICEKCPYLKDNICQYDKDADEEIRKMDKRASSLLKIEQGAKVRWHEIKRKIPEIFPEWSKNYCIECDWKKVCRKNPFYQELMRR